MRERKEQISITIDKALLKQIDELAKRDGRSRSYLIESILKQSVPVMLGKAVLHEGREPTTRELLQIIHKLENRIEKLENEKKEV